MFSSDLAGGVVTHMKELDASRRALQALSAEILSASKRGIFAFHRGDGKTAKTELAAARKKLDDGRAIIERESRLAQEGMWRAAQEEYSEADLFSQYLSKQKIGRVSGVSDDPDLFIGGLSDLTGELTRRAVLLASERKREDVERIFEDVSAVVDFFLRMDLTGGLRTKVDQAKQNLRKIEEIRYDLAIRAS